MRAVGTWFRVTPEGGRRHPVYFLDTIELPEVPQPDFIAEVGGAFLLGEGTDDPDPIGRAKPPMRIRRWNR